MHSFLDFNQAYMNFWALTSIFSQMDLASSGIGGKGKPRRRKGQVWTDLDVMTTLMFAVQ